MQPGRLGANPTRERLMRVGAQFVRLPANHIRGYLSEMPGRTVSPIVCLMGYRKAAPARDLMAISIPKGYVTIEISSVVFLSPVC